MSTISVERDVDTIAIAASAPAAPAAPIAEVLTADTLLQELEQKLSATDTLPYTHDGRYLSKTDLDAMTPELLKQFTTFKIHTDDWLYSTLPSINQICLDMYKHDDCNILTPYKQKKIKRVFNANAYAHLIKTFKDDAFSKRNLFEMHKGAYSYADLLNRYDEATIEEAVRQVSFTTPASFAKYFMVQNLYTSSIFDVMGMHRSDANIDSLKTDFANRIRQRDIALVSNPKALEQAQIDMHGASTNTSLRISNLLHEVSSKFLTDNPEKYTIKGPNDTLTFMLDKIKGVKELRKKLQSRLINDFYMQPTDFKERCDHIQQSSFQNYGTELIKAQKLNLFKQISAVLNNMSHVDNEHVHDITATLDNVYNRAMHGAARTYDYATNPSRWVAFLKFGNNDCDMILNTNLGITYADESFGTLLLGHYGLKGQTFSTKLKSPILMAKNLVEKNVINKIFSHLRYDKDYYDTTNTTDDHLDFKVFHHMLQKELSMQCEMFKVEMSLLIYLSQQFDNEAFGQTTHELLVIDSYKSLMKIIKKNAFMLNKALDDTTVSGSSAMYDSKIELEQSICDVMGRSNLRRYTTKLSFPKGIKAVFGDLIPDIAIEKLTSHVQKQYPVINKDDITLLVGSTEYDFELAATIKYASSKNMATTSMMKYQANSCMRHKTDYDDDTGFGFFKLANPANTPYTEGSLLFNRTFAYSKLHVTRKHPTTMYGNGDFLSINLVQRVTREGIARAMCGVHDLNAYRDGSNPNISYLCRDYMKKYVTDNAYADVDFVFVISPIYTVSRSAVTLTLEYLKDFANSIGVNHPLYEKFNGKKIVVLQALADSNIGLQAGSWSGLRINKVSAQTSTKAYGINKMFMAYVDAPALIEYDGDGHMTLCSSHCDRMENFISGAKHNKMNVFMNQLIIDLRETLRQDVYSYDTIFNDVSQLQFKFVEYGTDTLGQTRYRVLTFKNAAGGNTAAGVGFVYTGTPYLCISESGKVVLPDTTLEEEDVPLPQISGRSPRLGETVFIDDLELYDDEGETDDDYDDIDWEPEEEDDDL